MNCVQRTSEGSLMSEKGMMRTTQQASFDNFQTVNANGCGYGEEFFVDDLLDFSNSFDEEEEEREEQKQNRKDRAVSQNQKEETDNDNNSKSVTRSSSSIDDLSSIPCTELGIPVEDMENLEWLSHFLEDSFSGYPLTCPTGKLPEQQKANISVPETGVQAKPCFTTPIETKVRTKRARSGWHVRSFGSPSQSPTTASSWSTSSSSSSSSATSLSFFPPPNPWLTYTSPGQTAESVIKMRPRKKRKAGMEASGGGGGSQQRRCTHCGVHKTPQWRAGPLGAKTLCNACGVRYKSGRLLPEYRPAGSPTFSIELHSNNHRKVMALRRKKESDEDLAPPVQSF